MEDGLEIVVGTYEEFLLGYKLDNTGPEWKLVQSFATHAHTSSVRSVASAGPFLASGGADDKIIIHDMKNRTESRVLLHHSGTVNAVAFAEGGTHLLSGGADGSFTITRTGNWQIEKHWPKAHGGSPVSYISVHPSNKLALTLGEDRTLRTWNLIKGRKAYVINLNSKGTAHALSVTWGPEGQHFALTGYNDISVWAVSNAAIKHVLKCPSKSICMVFITEELAAVGLESGEIMMFNLESGNSTTLPAHTQRVKAITYSNGYLFSASSSGHIIVWKVKAKKMSLIEKCSVSTGCRITDITLIKPFEGLIKKEEDAPVQKETESIENENSENIKKESKKRKLSEESPPEVVIAEDTKVMRKRSYVPFVSVSLDNETKDKSPPKAESIENKNSENIKKKSKKRKLSEECPPEVVIAEDTKVMCKRSYIPLVSAKAYKKKKGNKNKNKKN